MNANKTPKLSLYEQSREERIKENLERMQEMGLMDLSLQFKSTLVPPKRTPRSNPSSAKLSSRLLPQGPLRRSSRLQNVIPVSYSEAILAKKNGLLEDEDVRLERGLKPEVYTEEHEKLLGNTERSWKLFVDGCGKDGKRVYDQVNGKTCHQCRQKTMGYRTCCSQCKMVQGQFCGDCLYMRYGEHVLEALENPNWICPVCRGICNCSLCRQAKGWHPTGALYRKISSMGYKSVAHYLIQTRRSHVYLGKESVAINEVSAKQSLPFLGMEAPSKESPQVNNKNVEPLKPSSQDKLNGELKSAKQEQMISSGNPAAVGQAKRSLSFSGSKAQSMIMESAEVNHQVHDQRVLSKPKFEDEIGNDLRGDKTEISASEVTKNVKSAEVNHEIHEHLGLSKPKVENEIENEFHCEEQKEQDNSNVSLESCLKHKRKRTLAIEPSPDSIAARLRQRRGTGNGCGDAELAWVNEKISGVKLAVKSLLSNQEVEKEKEMTIENEKLADSNTALDSDLKLKQKPACVAEPNPDSVGGRLRQSRRMSKYHCNEGLTGTNEEPSEDAELKAVNEKFSDVELAVKNKLSYGEAEKEKEMNVQDEKHADSNIALDSGPKLKKKPACTTEPNPDNIGSRLRQRRRTNKGLDDEELPGTTKELSDVRQAFNNISSEKEPEISMKLTSASTPSEDCIAGRLRPRHKTI